jgi:hypothetical protein
MNKFGIDVLTDDQSRLIVKLSEQPEVLKVRDGGVYKENVMFSAIHIETSWTEKELDTWLFTSLTAYIGTFSRG